MSTSHVVVYLECGGLELYIPLSSLETNGYCPMGFLQPGHGSLIQLSGWYQLNDTASPPYRGQSGTLGKGRQGKKGDQVVVPCTSYPIFQALWYVLFVPLLHPAARSLKAPEIPAACCLQTASRWLNVTGLLLSTGVGCW